MDFIEKLSFSSSYDIILDIINQLSKQAIFILTVNTITLHKLAKLFVIYIFSKYGVSSHVTSYHRSKFILNFFCSLETVLDM